MKKQATVSRTPNYSKLWQAKAHAWGCLPVISWDDTLGVYPDGIGITKDGQCYYISQKGVRKITLVESLRIFRKRDAAEDGSSYLGSGGTYVWMRFIEKALQK